MDEDRAQGRPTSDSLLTDEELAAMAMAADPDAGLAPDAVPWSPGQDDDGVTLLPSWYMPMPRTRARGSWPQAVAAVVVVGFLVIGSCGLCITSGFLS